MTAALETPALDGRVALVTGGASGIGRRVVRALAAAGARVAVADVADTGGRTVAEQVDGTYVHLDVGEAASWDVAIEDVTDQLGAIELVYLGAGVALGEPDITQVSDEAYRRAVAANVDGVVYGVRAVVPGMRRRGGGAIVAAASLGGLTPMPWDPVYAMTQHAVIGLVRSLADGLRADHININAVCPSFTDTPMVTEASRAAAERLAVPLLAPGEVAGMVVRLLTTSVTGEAWFLQPGREPEAFRFGRVPGPRS